MLPCSAHVGAPTEPLSTLGAMWSGRVVIGHLGRLQGRLSRFRLFPAQLPCRYPVKLTAARPTRISRGNDRFGNPCIFLHVCAVRDVCVAVGYRSAMWNAMQTKRYLEVAMVCRLVRWS